MLKEGAQQIKQKDSPVVRTVLFDLDGTLIDHFSAIHRSVAFAQRQLGLPESDYATVRATVGGSVPVTLARLLGEARVEAAIPHFRDHFSRIMLEDVAPLPGAAELLATLKRRSLQLAVFTNKFTDHSHATLDHLGLTQWLDAIIGTGDVPWRKPELAFTHHALQQLGADAASTILIGDSPFDFQAADAAGLPCYLVATGSHSEAELRAMAKPAGIFADLTALGKQVFGLTEPSPATPS